MLFTSLRNQGLRQVGEGWPGDEAWHGHFGLQQRPWVFIMRDDGGFPIRAPRADP